MTMEQPTNPTGSRENQIGAVRKKLLSPLPSDIKQGLDQIRQWLAENPEEQETYNLLLNVAQENPSLRDEIHGLLQSMASKGYAIAVNSVNKLDQMREAGSSSIEEKTDISNQVITQPPNVQILMHQADDAYYAAEFDKAILLYDEIIKLQPDNQRAQQQKQKAELNRFSGKPGANIPRDAMKFYRQARSFIAAKDFNTAINLLTTAVEEARAKGIEFREANISLNKLQDLLTASEYKAKADKAAQEGSWENALDQYDMASRLDPSDESSIKMKEGLHSLLSAEALLDPHGIQVGVNKNKKLETIALSLQVTEDVKELVNTKRYKEILMRNALYRAESDLHKWRAFPALAPQGQLTSIIRASKDVLDLDDPALKYTEDQLRRYKRTRIFFALLVFAAILIFIVILILRYQSNDTPPVVTSTIAPTLTASITKTPAPTHTKTVTITPSSTSKPMSTATVSPTAISLDTGYINRLIIHPQETPNGKWIGQLARPQAVTILKQKIVSGDQWYFCEWEANGTHQQGWILAEYVTIGSTSTPSPTPTPTLTLSQSISLLSNNGYINTGLIHPQDNPNGKWVGQLNRPQAVTILQQKIASGDPWYFCEWKTADGNTKQGWILAKYITIGSTPTPRPTITP